MPKNTKFRQVRYRKKPILISRNKERPSTIFFNFRYRGLKFFRGPGVKFPKYDPPQQEERIGSNNLSGSLFCIHFCISTCTQCKIFYVGRYFLKQHKSHELFTNLRGDFFIVALDRKIPKYRNKSDRKLGMDKINNAISRGGKKEKNSGQAKIQWPQARKKSFDDPFYFFFGVFEIF